MTMIHRKIFDSIKSTPEDSEIPNSRIRIEHRQVEKKNGSSAKGDVGGRRRRISERTWLRSEEQERRRRRSGGRKEGGSVSGETVREQGGSVMDEAADDTSLVRELSAVDPLHFHSDEVEPHHGDHPFPQCLRRSPRVLLRQDLDQVSRQLWPSEAALHSPGEHRYTDLRRCLLRHRLQRYALLLYCFHKFVHFFRF